LEVNSLALRVSSPSCRPSSIRAFVFFPLLRLPYLSQKACHFSATLIISCLWIFGSISPVVFVSCLFSWVREGLAAWYCSFPLSFRPFLVLLVIYFMFAPTSRRLCPLVGVRENSINGTHVASSLPPLPPFDGDALRVFSSNVQKGQVFLSRSFIRPRRLAPSPGRRYVYPLYGFLVALFFWGVFRPISHLNV